MRVLSRISAILVTSAVVLGVCPASEGGGRPVDLRPRVNPEQVVRVSIELEAGGQALVGDRQRGSAPAEETRPLPMAVTATLQYDERQLAAVPRSPSEDEPRLLAVRHYEKAEASLQVDEVGHQRRLADNRRLVAVESGGQRATLFSPAGPLQREQLDLIDIVGNTAYLDALLPEEPVADGDTWKHAPGVMAGLLALDAVAFCEVESILESHNAHFAKVRVAGFVHGTVDGAATEHEVRGVYLLDRRLGRVVRLNLAVREQRSIGSATPGLDGVARLKIQLEPAAESAALSDEVVQRLRTARATGDVRPTRLRKLVHEAEELGFRIEHDRQWFLSRQQRESVTMRRVEASGLVAQCTLTVLPPKSEGRQTSLEQFQNDITFALGKRFGQLVSSRQWKNRAGHYCYEVVVRGTVDQVPVEWHYFLVQQASGHQVSAAVTIEGPMVERLGDADRQLIESLELFEPVRPAQTAERPRGNAATK